MQSFFRGWRRTLGVITLIMACALTSGWVRSHRLLDSARFPVADRNWIEADSRYGLLYFAKKSISSGRVSFRWETATANADMNELRIMPRAEEMSFHFLGAGIGTVKNPASPGKSQVQWTAIVPYCSVVVPLTALSAWLLLSKKTGVSSVRQTTVGEP